jgi:hypothetical protein
MLLGPRKNCRTESRNAGVRSKPDRMIRIEVGRRWKDAARWRRGRFIDLESVGAENLLDRGDQAKRPHRNAHRKYPPQAIQELLRDNSHRETEKGACYRSVSSLRRALTEAKLTEIDAAFVARESALVHVTTKRTFRLLAQLEPQFRRRYSCIL